MTVGSRNIPIKKAMRHHEENTDKKCDINK